MKKFLTLTAILEGLTGIALIAIPNSIVLFLFGKPTDGPEGKITAMLAGTAIVSLAVLCWILKETPGLQKLVKGMLFYNCVIIAIAIYGVFWYGLSRPGLWMIVFIHSILFVWGTVTLIVKRYYSNV
jgi:peptidoglycan biosynthesis protein MviN/MurJ (putative lipid II flippase)